MLGAHGSPSGCVIIQLSTGLPKSTLGGAPHPVIVTRRDTGDSRRVLSYSDFATAGIHFVGLVFASSSQKAAETISVHLT